MSTQQARIAALSELIDEACEEQRLLVEKRRYKEAETIGREIDRLCNERARLENE